MGDNLAQTFGHMKLPLTFMVWLGRFIRILFRSFAKALLCSATSTLLLLGFFALVTRFEPSVLRATVMAGGSALAAARGRTTCGLRLLGASVVVLLLGDPLLVHRAAFQLSVAA